MIRTYSEMIQHPTFEQRFDYLNLVSSVGAATFGFDRWINQAFYRSLEWKNARRDVIARDMGLDLGCVGYEIYDKVIVHHMNPLTPDDIDNNVDDILDPEFLVCVSHKTHNAIHFGDRGLLPKTLPERRPGDTVLWAKQRREK